jgi:hypothetical protein
MDEADCERREIRVSRNGLQIRSPWCFEEGAILSVAVGCPTCGGEAPAREALVLSCERAERAEGGKGGEYLLTLYFLDAIPLDGGAARALPQLDPGAFLGRLEPGD